MEVILSPIALEDLKFWKQSGNTKIIQRIKKLIEATKDNPFGGIGKPEPLKYNYAGNWSRRISDEHRMIYKIEAGSIIIITLKDHY